ncbi:hypothetical protein KKA13_01720 [Patescibacteria group bacterium]|nr:hypothetical protein [Patescibacteria group bacterium]MBU1613200.1 hypothetical protein [Patescibacteria group bacterium]
MYYSAESQVLLISRSIAGVDPYTQAKAAERIGENLVQVMNTVDFYNKVMESNTVDFDRARWQNTSERNRRKQWQKDVVGEVVYGTSLLKLTAYARTQSDAQNFSQAITDTLVSRGWEYVGGDVTIKIVSTPLVSRLPARPNYVINAIAGFALGVLLSAWYVSRHKKGVFGRF